MQLMLKGDTIVIAYFGKFDDSVILKLTDNGNTWTKTVFLDFPIDKYIFDWVRFRFRWNI